MKIRFILVLPIVLLISCEADKLTREHAAEIIKSTYPKAISEYLQKTQTIDGWEPTLTNREKNFINMINVLCNSGVITLDKQVKSYFRPDQLNVREYNYVIRLSPEGQRFLTGSQLYSWKVKTYDLVFDQITGIAEDENSKTAKVNYLVKRINTPFSELYNYDFINKIQANSDNRDLERSATFKKYDDGWRVEDNTEQKSIRLETTTSNTDAYISHLPNNVPGKNNQPQSTVDREKFIRTFTWSGECPNGCFYKHTFRQNGTVETIFETARSSETYSENWTVDENDKIVEIGKDKWYYRFINQKIRLTSVEHTLDTHELIPEE